MNNNIFAYNEFKHTFKIYNNRRLKGREGRKRTRFTEIENKHTIIRIKGRVNNIPAGDSKMAIRGTSKAMILINNNIFPGFRYEFRIKRHLIGSSH